MPRRKRAASTTITKSSKSAKAQRTTEKFRLLNLPRELRDHIYSFAIEDTECGPNGEAILGSTPAITRTCKQVRAEALQIFYETKDFGLPVSAACLCRARNILEHVGKEHMKMVKSLKVDLLFLHGFATPTGWGQATEEFLSEDCKLKYTATLPSTARAFQASCAMMKKMRKAGVEWEDVKDILAHTVTILESTGWDGVWPVGCSGSHHEDEDEDDGSGMDSDESSNDSAEDSDEYMD